MEEYCPLRSYSWGRCDHWRAGSVVTKDIPSNSIAVGNPTKVVAKKGDLSEDISMAWKQTKV